MNVVSATETSHLMIENITRIKWSSYLYVNTNYNEVNTHNLSLHLWLSVHFFFLAYMCYWICACRPIKSSMLALKSDMMHLGLQLTCQNSRRKVYKTGGAEMKAERAAAKLVFLLLGGEQTNSDRPDWFWDLLEKSVRCFGEGSGAKPK